MFITVRRQGTRGSIQRLLDKGYNVHGERNGNWVLVKDPKVLVTLEFKSGDKTINMKQEIINHYGRTNISQKLVNEFENDVKNNMVIVSCDNNQDF